MVSKTPLAALTTPDNSSLFGRRNGERAVAYSLNLQTGFGIPTEKPIAVPQKHLGHGISRAIAHLKKNQGPRSCEYAVRALQEVALCTLTSIFNTVGAATWSRSQSSVMVTTLTVSRTPRACVDPSSPLGRLDALSRIATLNDAIDIESNTAAEMT